MELLIILLCFIPGLGRALKDGDKLSKKILIFSSFSSFFSKFAQVRIILHQLGNCIPLLNLQLMTQRELQKNSPYKAAMTGCGFMVDEMTRVLPLLMADNANSLLKDEVENNELLMIATKTTRDKAVLEFKRRYKSIPRSFWEAYLKMSPKMQVLAMFFVNLKTYKVFFDFQIEVVLRKWNSFNQTVTKNDLLSELSNIACNDEFVDTWTEETRDRVVKGFLAVLRKVGILNDKDSDIHPLNDYSDEELKFFAQLGEPWFLEAILLPQYRINNIKAEAV